MIDKNTNEKDLNERSEPEQSPWAKVSESISMEGLNDLLKKRPATSGETDRNDDINGAKLRIEDKSKAAPEAPSAKLEDPMLKLINKEISAHEAHDKTRSYLAKAFDLVYSPDSKTLKDLKGLSERYSDAIKRGDTAASEQMKQKIEDKIKEDMKAVLDKNTVDQLASNFTKTMFLFLNGTVGVAGTIASYSLDQMRPDSSLSEQLIDGTAGAAKGALMRAILTGLGKADLPIALKGLSLGVSSRLLEAGLNPQTYLDKDTNQIDVTKGLSNTFLASVNGKAMVMDALIFSAAYGLTSVINSTAPATIAKSPFLSTVSTAYVFGATGSALNELNRQQESGQYDLTQIAWLGARDGAISALAASIGGLQSEFAWRKTTEFQFVKEGENGQFSFAKDKYYEVNARRVTNPAGENVPTKENAKGELAPKDSWIIERAPGDRYPIKQAEFDLRWQPVPGKPGVFSPRPVPTAMVELSAPLDIKTSWGDMHGKVGDFLVRYGEGNFAILDRKVLTETYVGSNAQSKAKLEAIKAEFTTKST